jgi:hypothetical protein
VKNNVLQYFEEGILSQNDYPRCRQCNGDIDIEFQIMPGLLAQMDSDIGGKEELDWGVLNILTCKSNYRPKVGYM